MHDELVARQRAVTLRLAGRPIKAICTAAHAHGLPVMAHLEISNAVDAINAIGSLNDEANFEKGCLHCAYARVQINLNQLPVAKKHLTDAIKALAGIPTEEARKLKDEANDTLQGLQPPQSLAAARGLWARIKGWFCSG